MRTGNGFLCLLIGVVGVLSVAKGAAANNIALFPLDSANAHPSLVTAVEVTLGAEFQSRRFTVMAGAPVETALKQALAAGAPAAEPAVSAPSGEAAPEASGIVGATPSPVAGTAETAAPKAGTGFEMERESAEEVPPGEASQPVPAAATQEPAPVDIETAKRTAAQALGAHYYIDGTVVRLGSQIALDLRMHRLDGSIVVQKQSTVAGEAALPGAVQATVVAFIEALRRQAALSERADTVTKPTAAPPAPATPSRAQTDSGVISNFGVAVGQLISLSDQMYTYTFLHFNGRFEFNQLMLITNAGFAIGNRDAEDGFHFNLNLALAGYLTQTQVSPYLGGGVGLFIGNRLTSCEEELDEWGDPDSVCDEPSVVGWDVFPLLGVEVLKTRRVRVHVESRYLVSFDAYKTWGHGPMIVIGAAF